ncbi:ABC transporter substrate-binding protein [Stakelama pacifica]|uniref:Iron complex transport system substrate-binding protein n=1 Tax=Stakelama pacifica TaxID=517720 RepID=A0A4R6FUC8_9SPHN|nr:ABC transporter substrate-binding protein [Stakelama pacifica]TDN84495.1 iron complex transport system substrate-binding protein [Stakelama pacifica]GGO93643.1 cobalamin ABC transporter substrate-binding protein [Stakelama pacifica]
MLRRVILLALPLLTAAAAPAPPHRIVSLNLCADQYLLALADRDQIAALTQFARDPQMSAAAAAARNLPVSEGSAEQVLLLHPDLILVSPYLRSATVDRLRGRGIAIREVPSADSYDAILAQIRDIARAVGHPERGEALIARMNARLARLPENPGRGRVAAYYQRRGFLTGTGTLIDDLMRRLGLVNLATKLDKPVLSRMGLEEMALAHPDFLMVESATDKVTDRGTEMLHHPLLRDIPRLSVPQAWTVCGGPAYVLAAESLARQLQR